MTTVSIVSDLHLEFADITLPGGDILILAGDIWLARDMRSDGGANPSRRIRYVRFCQKELTKYSRVLAITGNHEAYSSNICEMADTIRTFLYTHAPNVTLLVNETEIIDGVAFLGTPLWATCGVGNPVTEMKIGGGMNDFKLIRTNRPLPDGAARKMVGKERAFTPRDANELHQKCVAWLASELPKHEKVVVIGHHAPSFRSANGLRYGTEELDPAYCSILDDFIEAHPEIKIHIHGHTHRPERYCIGETKVIANPRGYWPDEKVARDFDPRAADFRLEDI